MTPKVPTSESGTATLGDGGGARRAQEDEDDEHDEPQADEERVLDVHHRGANALRAVDGDVHVDGGRDGGRELGQRPP